MSLTQNKSSNLQQQRICTIIGEGSYHQLFDLLRLRPHVSDEYGHQKQNFSKTLPRVEMYENAVFICSCGWMKTELLKNVYVIVWYRANGHVIFLWIFLGLFFKPNNVFWDQLSFDECSSWLHEEEALSGIFRSRSWRSVLNALTKD